eukprot:scaffold257_cov241-Pinguiococcus_pyrenoidosus.AAC.8
MVGEASYGPIIPHRRHTSVRLWPFATPVGMASLIAFPNSSSADLLTPDTAVSASTICIQAAGELSCVDGARLLPLDLTTAGRCTFFWPTFRTNFMYNLFAYAPSAMLLKRLGPD